MAEPYDTASEPRRVVVGAAIVRDGRVLACRRTRPAEAAGRWEFPGGKVEIGEPPETALVRELSEELGVESQVMHWLAGAAVISERYELRVAVVGIDGEPQPREHDQVRWLDAEQLDDVDWLPPDRPFLPQLREILTP